MLAELENLRAAQIEIEHSQQLYAELFEMAPIGYVNLTSHGRIHTANAAAAALINQSRPIIAGTPFSVYVASSDQAAFIAHLGRCRNAGTAEVCTELRLKSRAGWQRIVELVSRPSIIFGSTQVIFRTVLRDITERKQFEEALAGSEARLRAIIEHTTAGVAQADLDGRVVFTNAQFCRMLGYREGKLLGKNLKDLTHPEDRTALWRSWSALESAGTPFQARQRLLCQGKRFIWATVNASAVAGPDGKPAHIVLIAIDVTALVGAEAELASSREQFRLVVDNLREYAIFSTDLDRRITSWYTGAERLLGYDLAEILGRSADVIFTPEDQKAGLPGIEARTALEEGRAMDDRWHVRRDGSRFWGSGVMMPMHDTAGKTVGFVKIFRDETEIRQAREELEKNRENLWQALQQAERAWQDAEAAGKAKDRFLAVLSHELRTPLTPIFMTTHILARRTDLPDDVREAVEMIRRNIHVEARLVDDLLDLTRIARGKMEVVPGLMDVHEAIGQAVEISRPDIEAKQQRLTVLLEARKHSIQGDSARLQQVVWNLLKNASKFTPEGGEICVRCRNARSRLIIEVSDTGIGIKADALERIFDPFEQADERITRQFGGLGLGLAISKATVEAHDGVLHARSDGPGKGATFALELPL